MHIVRKHRLTFSFQHGYFCVCVVLLLWLLFFWLLSYARSPNMRTIGKCVCLGFLSYLFLCFIEYLLLLIQCRFSQFFCVFLFLGYWVFGAQFCDTWIAVDVMCSTASILNLCAISLDRYIHIKDPLR